MGKTYLASDPNYFSTAPESPKYAQIGAEAMGYRKVPRTPSGRG